MHDGRVEDSSGDRFDVMCLKVLDYLEASNKMIYKDERIVWVAADNPKLRRLIEASVRLR